MCIINNICIFFSTKYPILFDSQIYASHFIKGQFVHLKANFQE